MKTTIVLLLTAAASMVCAQTATAPVVAPTPATPAASLPAQVVGGGTTWLRGSAYPLSADAVIGLRIGTTNFYSWTDIGTPIAKTPAGSAPLASSITTGAAWVAAQSANGRVSLVAIAQGGFTSTSSTAGISATVSGSFGVPIKVSASKQLYVMPGVKLANQTASSAVVQPFISILYGFGAK